MLLFRRTTLFGALAPLAVACSAPDARGLFESSPAPGTGNPIVVPGCIERCRSAALKCTLIDVPCESFCGMGPSGEQLSCLEREGQACKPGGSVVARCVGAGDQAKGFFGARCDCASGPTCQGGCLQGLTCFDPGGSDNANDFASLFPGFCSKPCDPAGTDCPQGFLCREQLFNNAPTPSAGKNFWCER
jgi:hypothetical protein